MPSRSHGTLLIEEVDRLEDSIRRLAIAMVDNVIRQELQRRLDAMRKSVAPRARAERMRVASATKPELSTLSSAVAQATHRKGLWTREAIVHELATWLASGTTIDAAFVSRHGPPGLVAATRKTFGRFEAALNVASLQVAKLYPEGPPSRGVRLG